MQRGCTEAFCTVADTGHCLRDNDAGTCPYRAPLLPGPDEVPSFRPSLSLTPDEVRTMMAERYCRIVGILGQPNAGKTAALVSLYLLVSRGWLTGFRFADSRSLMAFNEISAGARRWGDGKVPDQLTAHTRLDDHRSAGFLHLRLRTVESNDACDLLLPDLPGEWSTDLIDSFRTDRLEFLRRADVIWLMVDGVQLKAPARRLLAVHRTKLLMQRLVGFLKPCPPIILVLTRADKGMPMESTLTELRDEANGLGLSLEVAHIASFARGGRVKPGAGIPQLIDATLRAQSATACFWPAESDGDAHDRWMMRFRVAGHCA